MDKHSLMTYEEEEEDLEANMKASESFFLGELRRNLNFE